MRLGLIILAILYAKGPNTGYGLGRLLRNDLSDIWQVKLQQIYVELKRLRSAGHVSVEAQADRHNRPARKMYNLTTKGLTVLDQYLAEEPFYSHKDDLFARALCLGRIGSVALSSRLEERLRLREDRVAALRTQLSSTTKDIGQWLALSCELHRFAAEAEWCRYALEALSTGEESGKQDTMIEELSRRLLA